MYISLRHQPAAGRDGPRSRAGAAPRVVVLLGLTSLFTDVSSEMITAILPVYLVLQLGLAPSQFGLVDGLYRGVSAVSGLAAGVVSDWLGRPKLVASMGYGLSALTRPLLLVASSVGSVAGLISLDRIGKGIRTAPRDAMIAEASPPGDLGHSFGVHRAMDTVGALLGPLVAFGVLLLLPGRFDAVFVVSTAFALVGLAVVTLLVPERQKRLKAQSTGLAACPPRLSRADLVALFRSRTLVTRVGLAGLLTLFTVSDAFLFIALLDRDPGLVKAFPLFAVGLALAYSVLAIPVGRLADRVGRMPLYLGGHVALLAVYATIHGLPTGPVTATVVALLLLGLFYAATDGVLAAAVSAALPDVSRASGMALVQTAVGVCGFVSSVGFGLLLTRLGSSDAYRVMAVGLSVALVIAVCLLRQDLTSAVSR
ncbi:MULTISPECIES: MFS transporter [unclassified Knoellia]|uniref:MFS transporter n=1 Tax=Knoellia altitudinis TaxID=3404795 RepID=UPI003611461A